MNTFMQYLRLVIGLIVAAVVACTSTETGWVYAWQIVAGYFIPVITLVMLQSMSDY